MLLDGTETAAQARDKINAADARDINLSGALTTEIAARIASMLVEAQRRADADASEAGIRAVNDAAIKLFADMLATRAASRPGDSPDRFTASTVGGDPALLAPLSAANVQDGDSGSEYWLTGAGLVVAREYTPVEPGRTYAVRGRGQQRTDSADPYGNSVEFGVLWYDQTRSPLAGANAKTIIQKWDNRKVASGVLDVTKQIAFSAGAGIARTIPASARYGRRYARYYGATGSFAVQVLRLRDSTDDAVLPPVAASMQSALSALQAADLITRTTALENAAGDPSTLTFRSKTDAAAATIAVGITAVRLLGYSTAGDGGAATYARVGSQPSHPGKFQSADGGWWQIVDRKLSPEQFGMKGDNSTINDTAFQNYCAAAIALGRPCRDGVGTYVFSAKQTIDCTAGALDFEVSGPLTCIFKFTGTDGGLEFIYAGGTKLRVRPPMLLTTRAGGGIALKVTGPGTVDPVRLGGPDVQWAFALGDDISTHYWDKHFVFEGCWYPWLANFMWTGKNDTIDWGTFGANNSAQLFSSLTGVEMKNCQGPILSGFVQGSHTEQAIVQTGVASSTGEGWSVKLSGEIVGVRDGIILNNAGGAVISGFHISASRLCLRAAGHAALKVDGMLYLKWGGENWIGEDWYNAISCTSDGNRFWAPGTEGGTINPVLLRNNCDALHIVNARGLDLPSGVNFITLGSGTQNSTFIGNRCADDCNPIAINSDIGTGNVFYGNTPVPEMVMASGATTFNAKLIPGEDVRTSNLSATNFSGFTGGRKNQRIRLWFGEANTTLVYHATQLRLKGGSGVATVAAPAYGFLDLQYSATLSAFVETNRSW